MRQGKLRHPWQPGKTGDLQERTGGEPERFAKPIDLKRLRIVPAVLRQKRTPAYRGAKKKPFRRQPVKPLNNAYHDRRL